MNAREHLDRVGVDARDARRPRRCPCAREHRAVGVDDLRVAEEAQRARAGRSGWSRPRRPGSRPRARRRARRSGASGGRAPGSARGWWRSIGHADRQAIDLGAVERERASGLGEELVVTEQHPEPADRRVEGGEALAGRCRRSARRAAGGPCGGGRWIAVAADADRRRVRAVRASLGVAHADDGVAGGLRSAGGSRDRRDRAPAGGRAGAARPRRARAGSRPARTRGTRPARRRGRAPPPAPSRPRRRPRRGRARTAARRRRWRRATSSWPEISVVRTTDAMDERRNVRDRRWSGRPKRSLMSRLAREWSCATMDRYPSTPSHGEEREPWRRSRCCPRHGPASRPRSC